MATDDADWLSTLISVFRWLLGNIKLGSNPTFYRSPSEYFSLLQKEVFKAADPADDQSVFELQRANSVYAYVKVILHSLLTKFY